MKYCLLFILSISNLKASLKEGDPPLWNSTDMVSFYHHNSFLQMNWAQDVIFENHTFKQTENVIDYGSGDGKITALVSKLVPNGTIKGLDISSDMVSFSKRKYPSATYPNLGFYKVTAAEPIPGFVANLDIIYSSCVMHLVQEPEKLLREMNKSLKSGGKLILVFPFMDTRTALMRASAEVYSKHGISFPKMSDESNFIRSTPSGLQTLAERVGFKTIKVRIKETVNPFISKREFVDWLEGTLSGNQVIPYEIRRAVSEQTADKYLLLSPKDMLEDGSIHYHFPVVEYVGHKF